MSNSARWERTPLDCVRLLVLVYTTSNLYFPNKKTSYTDHFVYGIGVSDRLLTPAHNYGRSKPQNGPRNAPVFFPFRYHFRTINQSMLLAFARFTALCMYRPTSMCGQKLNPIHPSTRPSVHQEGGSSTNKSCMMRCV